MNNLTKRNAWIQSPDDMTYDIGEISRDEIEKLWGSRWAQKCIRDVAEEVAIARFSPFPRAKSQVFCSPQLTFENKSEKNSKNNSKTATLTVSPWIDVTPTILYGSPLQDFDSWSVSLHVKRGCRFLGFIPMDYCFQIVVLQDDAFELVRLFYDCGVEEIVAKAKIWREQINERYRYRLVNAFFL
ncbi:MAG: hypothetical protein LBI18_01640 [Planctomycetaceae bacterium]|jgi:hypothetical protein|nr:hypothetical protein [Planctomycetaceae bacterium]